MLVVFIAGASALAAPPSRLAVMESYASMRATAMSSARAGAVGRHFAECDTEPRSGVDAYVDPDAYADRDALADRDADAYRDADGDATDAYADPDSHRPGGRAGQQVQRRTQAQAPEVAPDGRRGPVRVGAICRDGSGSSATGRGACSWHGGVARWLSREAVLGPGAQGHERQAPEGLQGGSEEVDGRNSKEPAHGQISLLEGSLQEGKGGLRDLARLKRRRHRLPAALT